jgi:hypothetical protein
MGSPLGRARWSRRLISNAPARKQLRLGIARPFVEASDFAESSTFVPLGGSSTREPEWRAFWLEARSKDSGVQWVREAVAHVGRTLVGGRVQATARRLHRLDRGQLALAETAAEARGADRVLGWAFTGMISYSRLSWKALTPSLDGEQNVLT